MNVRDLIVTWRNEARQHIEEALHLEDAGRREKAIASTLQDCAAKLSDLIEKEDKK